MPSTSLGTGEIAVSDTHTHKFFAFLDLTFQWRRQAINKILK